VTSAQGTPDPAPILLRRMVVSDLDELFAYEREMFGPEAWSRRSYLDELADAEFRHYLVAADGDTVLGCAGLLVVAETAQIVTIAVLPHARRQGIARALLRALVREAGRRQAEEVILEVRVDNAAARGLYEREGFTVIATRKGYYDHGRVDALVMRRELSGLSVAEC
jgi:ribosomal-protein-alanine N-acetyltransferase